MKKLSLLTVFLAVFFVLTINSADAQWWENVSATNLTPCYDIQGQTTPVNVDGVPNSGVMNFDAPPSELSGQYAACVRMSDADPAVAVPTHLEGWVWNDNLGWISLYCNNGKNLGADCGNEDYQVDFQVEKTNPSLPANEFSRVRLSGYAWGDNVGYISFDSIHHELELIPNGPNKGEVVSSASYPAGAHTWAQSVGWFNWEGVMMPWFMTPEPVPLELCSSIDLVDGTCDCNWADPANLAPIQCAEFSDFVPHADNMENWSLNTEFVVSGITLNSSDLVQDCDPSPISIYTENTTGSETYSYCIRMGFNDSVSLDQTTDASQGGLGGSSAVTKPNNLEPAHPFSFEITSNAPTSDYNVSELGDADAEFSNENFVYSDNLSGYDKDAATNGRNNILNLDSFQVRLFRYSPDGAIEGGCVLGSFNGTTAECGFSTIVANRNLPFKPVVELEDLYQVDGSDQLDFISMARDDSSEINYSVVKNTSAGENDVNIKSVEFKLGVEGDLPDGYTAFGRPELNGDGDEVIVESIPSVSNVNSDNWLLKLAVDEENVKSGPVSANFYLYSI
ncbi:hypothetical protein GF376_03930, partial [Candidatus Peregrinibacteria bacterium]|nr:hypothetical protein [Candidatus Peregrinibacteria bacterium]